MVYENLISASVELHRLSLLEKGGAIAPRAPPGYAGELVTSLPNCYTKNI